MIFINGVSEYIVTSKITNTQKLTQKICFLCTLKIYMTWKELISRVVPQKYGQCQNAAMNTNVSYISPLALHEAESFLGSCLPVSIFPSSFLSQILYTSLISIVCAICSAHPPCFHHHYNI